MIQRDAEHLRPGKKLNPHAHEKFHNGVRPFPPFLHAYVNGGGYIYITWPPYSCLSRIKVLPVLETPPQSRQFLRFDGANRPDRSHKGDRSTSGNCSGKIVHRNDTIKLSTCVQRTYDETQRREASRLPFVLCPGSKRIRPLLRTFCSALLHHSDDVTICRCIFMNNAFHAIGRGRVFSFVFVRFFWRRVPSFPLSSSSEDDGFVQIEKKFILFL